MTDSAPHTVSEDSAQNTNPATSGGPADSLSELRELLLSPEQTQLALLRQRLEDPKQFAEELSRVIAEAIQLRSSRDQELTGALLPSVEEAIQVSVRRSPRVLVEALFPVMGPAIRKAVASALRGMLQSLNEALEHSLSLQGLKWRLEALRTGKPFAEVVLLHTLLYRMEQLFLIHKETGLLLQHVVAGTLAVSDADMVSGMLTAIQDFVRDSFAAEQSETLQELQVGELSVWIEQGPQAVLAGVIRGTAPQGLKSVFQGALEKIHLEYRGALSDFRGDASPFAACRDDLEACLHMQYATPQTEKREQKFSPLMIIVGAALLVLGVWGFFSLREHMRWADYVARLKAEPGIVVTSIEKRNGKRFIAGLRDPLAVDPLALLRSAKLDSEAVVSRWEPFQVLVPEFVLARAKAVLQPPAGVTLSIENGILTATGSASRQWILDAQRLMRVMPGIAQFRTDQLVDADLAAIKSRFEGQVIRFIVGTTQLVPGQGESLRKLTANLMQLDEMAVLAERRIQVEIVGHTDQTASTETNTRLSQNRADSMARILGRRGLRMVDLSVVGVGSKEPLRPEVTDQDKEFNRSVSFRVRAN